MKRIDLAIDRSAALARSCAAHHLSVGFFCLLFLFTGVTSAATSKSPAHVGPVGLGLPGNLVAVELSTGRESATGASTPTIMAGRDSRLQLLVTGRYDSGQLRDLTRGVQFQVEPAGAVEISDTGLVLPKREGLVAVTATVSPADSAVPQDPAVPQRVSAKITLEIRGLKTDVPVNFPNQIVPIFTKYGCNGGGCHGKASGQNGFKLSLLGFEPSEDFEHLVKESRGRRLFPAAPDESLLLTKAIGKVPHGGGKRLEQDSPSYALLRRWITQGMPYGNPDDPVVESIEVFPKQRTMPQAGEQQLTVVAHYSDGSRKDVTRMTQFDPNVPEIAECSETGLVSTLDQTGDVGVMARYQAQVAVFRGTVPLGAPTDSIPEPNNFVDELVFNKLEMLGLPPSEPSDDATFIRRVSVDIAGRLPAPHELKMFLENTDPDKRNKLIDRLLDSPQYADFFANKWNSVLRNRGAKESFRRGTFAMHSWIRQSLYENKPYDQFVREIVAATGGVAQNPAVVWYRSVREMNEQVEDTAQLFLGMRLQCARCHHHPFEKWSQQDYYSMAAFFSRVGRKPGGEPSEERIFHKYGTAQATNPKTHQKVVPAGLDAEPQAIAAETDPRQKLVDWMADPSNPFFAKALVNRYWKHFFNHGLVEPEDDMRVTNPPANPELLDAMAKHFVASKFDLKQLIRTICQSKTYQLSSEPNEYNADDKQNFSRYYPKRLTAEVLLDAINQVTSTGSAFSGLPAGTRAVELADSRMGSYFLTVFGRPEGTSACECERSGEANLAQSLHMLNSAEIQSKLSADKGRAASLAQDASRSDVEKVTDLYLRLYSRSPTEDELQVALRYIAAKKENLRIAYEDILWALLNTKEFLFNH